MGIQDGLIFRDSWVEQIGILYKKIFMILWSQGDVWLKSQCGLTKSNRAALNGWPMAVAEIYFNINNAISLKLREI